jgi:hypothetical protein
MSKLIDLIRDLRRRRGRDDEMQVVVIRNFSYELLPKDKRRGEEGAR